MSTTGGNLGQCPFCDGWHSMPCPRVKSIEYYPNGTIKKVEYVGDARCEPVYGPLPVQPTEIIIGESWLTKAFPDQLHESRQYINICD